MTAKEALEQAVKYSDFLSRQANIMYKGERKKGVLAGIQMMRTKLEGMIRELDEQEVSEGAEGETDVPPGAGAADGALPG